MIDSEPSVCRFVSTKIPALMSFSMPPALSSTVTPFHSVTLDYSKGNMRRLFGALERCFPTFSAIPIESHLLQSERVMEELWSSQSSVHNTSVRLCLNYDGNSYTYVKLKSVSYLQTTTFIH